MAIPLPNFIVVPSSELQEIDILRVRERATRIAQRSSARWRCYSVRGCTYMLCMHARADDMARSCSAASPRSALFLDSFVITRLDFSPSLSRVWNPLRELLVRRPTSRVWMLRLLPSRLPGKLPLCRRLYSHSQCFRSFREISCSKFMVTFPLPRF